MTCAPQANPSAEEHAASAALGDSDALACLYERFADPLLRYLVLRTHKDLELAEDIAGNTWEKVARKIRDYRPKGNGFEAWLFSIARNALREHFRWAGRRPERLMGEMLDHDMPDGSESQEDLLERKFESDRIASEVQALPRQQRRCIILRFFVGLTVNETAAVMNRSPNAVKQMQHRATRLLRERLGDHPMFHQTTTADVVATTDYEPSHAATGENS